MNLKELAPHDASLVQHGLSKLGFYKGTFAGRPGPLTAAAYDEYLLSLATAAGESVPANLARDTPLGERLATILEAEVGVREVPLNSNKGARVQEYQSATWLSGTGWAWCAAFICWGVLQVRRDLESLSLDLPCNRPETAGAWDFERWARGEPLPVRLHKPRTKIKRGDILVYEFSHIGLAVEDEKSGSVKTVEGNTNLSGSREGGGVYIQKRAVSLVRSNIRLD